MTLEEHLRHPEISINAHIAMRAAELAGALEGKLAIYLDTRFWIMVREVRDGTSQLSKEREIVRSLEKLVDSGRAFCPIGEPTFSELMKQGGDAQRQATAEAIDSLSYGVSILPDTERIVDEAEGFLLRRLRVSPNVEPRRAWTRLAYVLGEIYPDGTPFPPEMERAIQKAFFDHLGAQPIVSVARTLDSESFTQADTLQTQADELNAANAVHRDAMKSFDQVLEQEFHGVAEVVASHSRQLPQLFSPLKPETKMLSSQVIANVIREILKREDDARWMPTAHVHAVLHALFRWEYRHKKITPNDLVDFRHAAAALSHCSLLLTEGTLRNALAHRRLSLARVHGTTVLSDRDEVAVHLERLLS